MALLCNVEKIGLDLRIDHLFGLVYTENRYRSESGKPGQIDYFDRQTPYERSITKQPHSHITGQNRLQTLGHLLGLPWDQPQFRAPPDSPLGGRTPQQCMTRCPRRPIGPQPPRSTPVFKWIHSPESESSTLSE
ncbi:hypothetical protein M9H77_08479 [Catharanthus roseus]|uniref:Uncharacterized protein n=1 Tax=Catharanthus roseus TaxID=4058 RepID=A0ACC0BY30_CATRO|nr:hypothetical protein M9H77_08479 [Catharanthus roseus]